MEEIGESLISQRKDLYRVSIFSVDIVFMRGIFVTTDNLLRDRTFSHDKSRTIVPGSPAPCPVNLTEFHLKPRASISETCSSTLKR